MLKWCSCSIDFLVWSLVWEKTYRKRWSKHVKTRNRSCSRKKQKWGEIKKFENLTLLDFTFFFQKSSNNLVKSYSYCLLILAYLGICFCILPNKYCRSWKTGFYHFPKKSRKKSWNTKNFENPYEMFIFWVGGRGSDGKGWNLFLETFLICFVLNK